MPGILFRLRWGSAPDEELGATDMRWIVTPTSETTCWQTLAKAVTTQRGPAEALSPLEYLRKVARGDQSTIQSPVESVCTATIQSPRPRWPQTCPLTTVAHQVAANMRGIVNLTYTILAPMRPHCYSLVLGLGLQLSQAPEESFGSESQRMGNAGANTHIGV